MTATFSRLCLSLILALVVVGALGGAPRQRDAERIFYKQEPLEINFEIRVALIGLDGTGAHKFSLDTSKLNEMLRNHMSSYSPSEVETGEATSTVFSIDWIVSALGQKKTQEYEAALQRAIDTSKSFAGTAALLPYASFTKFFESAHQELASSSNKKENQFYTIFVVAPDKSRLKLHAEHASYLYSSLHPTSRNTGSSVWIGSGRWIVMDLSSYMVEYGSINGAYEFSAFSLPYLERFHAEGKPKHPAIDSEVAAELAVVCLNAVKYVLIPDTKDEVVESSNKLLIPIVALQNHIDWDVMSHEDKGAIDFDAIEAEVKKMVPKSVVVEVAKAGHNLHDHKAVSMAIYKSLRTSSIFQMNSERLYEATRKTYLDSNILQYEFKHSGDALVGGLLQIGENTKEGEQKNRVLPVFVLSVVGVEHGLTLENHSLHRSTADGVIVLQTNETAIDVPYFWEHRTNSIDGMNLATRHIIAGIANALGGILEPAQHYSRIHSTIKTDYSWAYGYNPFGNFENTYHMSLIIADSIERAQVLSRIEYSVRSIRELVDGVESFAKDYIFNPLGDRVTYVEEKESGEHWTDVLLKKAEAKKPVLREAIVKMKSEITRIAQQLNGVAGSISAHDLEAAHRDSVSFYSSVKELKSYISKELSEVELDLVCCYLRVDLEHPQRWFSYFFLGFSAAAVFALVYYLVAPAQLSFAAILRRRRDPHSGILPLRRDML